MEPSGKRSRWENGAVTSQDRKFYCSYPRYVMNRKRQMNIVILKNKLFILTVQMYQFISLIYFNLIICENVISTKIFYRNKTKPITL